MVVAEATEPLEEGELVRLLAVPVEKGEWPSGVVSKGGEQGEAVRVVTQGSGFVVVEDA